MEKQEQLRILESCHRHPTSGHMGSKRTLTRITERFMWPGVSKDVYHLVSVTCGTGIIIVTIILVATDKIPRI